MTNVKSKAWLYSTKKGDIVKNLQLTDYDIPSSKPDHILIEVLSVDVCPGDLKLPYVPVLGWFIQPPASLGHDFCGRIVALPGDMPPNDRRNLHVGQVVFGVHRDPKTSGTLKTLMWVHRDTVYPLPSTVSPAHGAALGVGAMTAYQALAPHVKPGDKVLITGGSGGVGTFAIQIAKALGLYVIATCSEAGVQLCRDLGADETLDYKSATFLEDLCRTQVDLVVDLVGNDKQSHRRSEGFLKPDGMFVLVGLMDDGWAGVKSMLVSWMCPTWLGGPARRWRPLFMTNAVSDYEPVAKMAEDGKFKVVVDSVFGFEDAPKAFERLLTGRAKGRIIVDVGAYGR